MRKILAVLLIIFIGAFSLVFGRLIGSGFSIDSPNIDENVIIEKPNELDEVDNLWEEPVEVVENTRINLSFVGDIMFHIPQINSGRTEDGFDFSQPFTYIKSYITKSDYSVANFETVTAGNDRGFSGFPMFNSPVETLDGIKDAGFDLLITSNNHSLDRGKTGIINTINEIRNRELDYLGTSEDSRRPYIFKEINGVKLALFSYTQNLNGLDNRLTKDELGRMVNLINLELIREDYIEAMEKNPDYSIIYLHWGNEYNRVSSQYQKDLAKELSSIGFDLIVGSHPHVIQEMDVISEYGKDTYVLYSLGNFISNQRYETMGVSYTEDGVILNITLNKDHINNSTTLEEINPIPTWVYRYWQGNKYHYYILPIEDVLSGKIYLDLDDATIKRMEKSIFDTLDKLNLK